MSRVTSHSVCASKTKDKQVVEGAKETTANQHVLANSAYNSQNNVYILQLPDELLLMILAYLGAYSLKRTERVCKQLRRVAQDNLLWFRLYRYQYRQGYFLTETRPSRALMIDALKERVCSYCEEMHRFSAYARIFVTRHESNIYQRHGLSNPANTRCYTVSSSPQLFKGRVCAACFKRNPRKFKFLPTTTARKLFRLQANQLHKYAIYIPGRTAPIYSSEKLKDACRNRTYYFSHPEIGGIECNQCNRCYKRRFIHPIYCSNRGVNGKEWYHLCVFCSE